MSTTTSTPFNKKHPHTSIMASAARSTDSQCPDGTICENKSPCISHPTKESKFICDCTQAVGTPINKDSLLGLGEYTKFAGVYCEHVSTSYCQKGNSPKHFHSFCTNGGECRVMIGRNEEHAGCKCPVGYEGNYCQFVRGSMPSDWELSDFMHPALLKPYSTYGSNELGAGGIVGIVFGTVLGAALLVGILAGYLYMGNPNSMFSRYGKDIKTAASSGDEDDPPRNGSLGGRQSSIKMNKKNNSAFIGGKSVYKKNKNSTGHFVTSDTLEADGAVLHDAMAAATMQADENGDEDIDNTNSGSMDEVDLDGDTNGNDTSMITQVPSFT